MSEHLKKTIKYLHNIMLQQRLIVLVSEAWLWESYIAEMVIGNLLQLAMPLKIEV